MKKLLITAIFLSLLATVTFAQDTKPTPPSIDDGDVVKISTTLIQVDATVTDKRGRVIADLTADDFEIFENGKKQNITNFSFVSAGKAQAKGKKLKNSKGQMILLPPVSRIRPEHVKRTVALVVDDLTLSFESTHFVRRALRKFVDEQMEPTDLVAIIRTGGGIGALQQFTSDKRMLYAAIKKVRFNLRGNARVGAFARIEATPLENLQSLGEEVSDEDLTDESRRIQEENEFREDIFASGSLGAINFIVKGMKVLPGRKSILLLSDGFRLTSLNGSNRIRKKMEQLIDLANRSAVVIYTMDARGLQYTGITAADNTSGLTRDSIAGRVEDRRDHLFETQGGLISLAKETGGFAIRNNNDLSSGIRRVLNDQSYYLIGYQPEEETFDPNKNRFHKLTIKVKRNDTKVRYRSGFFGISDEIFNARIKENSENSLVNALSSPFAVSDIDLSLNTLFHANADRGVFLRSLLHINPTNLTFVDEPNGRKKVVFDVVAMSFGDNGIPVDQISKTFTVLMVEERYIQIMDEGLVFDFTFPIKKAGAYQIRVALGDKASGKIGSASQFVEVPKLKKKRLTVSGIVVENLTYAHYAERQKTDSNEPIDSTVLSDTSLRKFRRGTVLSYGYEAYNAKFGKARTHNLTTRSLLYNNGKLIFEGKDQTVEATQPSDESVVRLAGALNLATSLEIGDYVLQIIVTDKLAKKKHQIATQFVQFEIIE